MKIHGLFSDFGELFSDIGYEGGAFLTIFIILLIFVFVICFVAMAFEIICRWIFFKKCGEAGWKAIIPVYNELTILKVAGMNWWWIFLVCASSILSAFNSSISSLSQATESIGLSLVSFSFSFLVLGASAFTIIAKIGTAINITKKFHKSGGFAVLIVFFEPIMFLILGLSKEAVYDKDVKVSPNGIFGPHPNN